MKAIEQTLLRCCKRLTVSKLKKFNKTVDFKSLFESVYVDHGKCKLSISQYTIKEIYVTERNIKKGKTFEIEVFKNVWIRFRAKGDLVIRTFRVSGSIITIDVKYKVKFANNLVDYSDNVLDYGDYVNITILDKCFYEELGLKLPNVLVKLLKDYSELNLTSNNVNTKRIMKFIQSNMK